MENLNKEYWMCIIGSTTRDKLPNGADAPMRMPVREAFETITGEEDENCWSGWGLSEKRRLLIMEVWNMEESELPDSIERNNL
jgi:hypothetical protein